MVAIWKNLVRRFYCSPCIPACPLYVQLFSNTLIPQMLRLVEKIHTEILILINCKNLKWINHFKYKFLGGHLLEVLHYLSKEVKTFWCSSAAQIKQSGLLISSSTAANHVLSLYIKLQEVITMTSDSYEFLLLRRVVKTWKGHPRLL